MSVTQRILIRISRYALSPLEAIFLRGIANFRPTFSPPVFVIGPPRSGTTLLYQLLVSQYPFAYFSNFLANFYYSPALLLWLTRAAHLKAGAAGNFNSDYGRTEGRWSPNEAGDFWYRWFPRGEHIYVPPQVTPRRALHQLRNEITGMSRVMKAPALFKNTYNSLRISPIVEALPEASFLVLDRNPIDTAQSILKGRIKATGTKETWWALPPREIDEIMHHPYWEQVVEQVYYITHQIDTDRQRFGPERFLDISYQSLCEGPGKTLQAIEDFFCARGITLTRRGAVPDHFPFSSSQQVDDEDYRRIVHKVHELWRT